VQHWMRCKPHWQERGQHTPPQQPCNHMVMSSFWCGHCDPGGAPAAAVPDQQLGLEHAWRVARVGACIARRRAVALRNMGAMIQLLLSACTQPSCYCINTACYRDRWRFWLWHSETTGKWHLYSPAYVYSSALACTAGVEWGAASILTGGRVHSWWWCWHLIFDTGTVGQPDATEDVRPLSAAMAHQGGRWCVTAVPPQQHWTPRAWLT
jgi:hypothetical protein